MRHTLNNIYKYNSFIYKIALIIVTIGLITFWLPKHSQFNYEYQQGNAWMANDLFAPFDYAISKSGAEIELEENEIKNNAKLYFTFDSNIKNDVFDNFEKNIFKLGNERAFEKKYLSRMHLFGQKLLDIIYTNGIIAKKENLEFKSKKRNIVLLTNNIARDITFDNIYSVNTAMELIDEKIYYSEFAEDRAFLDEVFLSILQQNVFYDARKTQKIIDEDISKISHTRGFVAKDTKIVSKGDIVGGETLNKLNSLKYEYESKTLNKSDYFWITIGYVIKVSILIIMLMLFLHQFKPKIYEDDNKTSFIYINLLLMVGLASVIVTHYPDFIYVLPIGLVPIILKSFFDSLLGLITHIIIVLLIGFMTQNSFEYTFIQITAGIVTVLSISTNYRRVSMFIYSGQITIIYFLTYFGYSISQKGDLMEINYVNFLLFAISGLFLTILAQPLIYLFEKTFKLVSDVSLLELSDTNSELLKELSNKAPGTFQHSLMVANLAESAANEIGANARLIRTGALYHDIGKMKNPLYFIENQQSLMNPHDELEPIESAKIIISHVSDGIEIAKKNNIPNSIIDFIRTHHGNSMVYYFYKQHEELLGVKVTCDDPFRYPGHIPHSRETAILMMVDAVEAASRTLKVYNSKSIENLVNKIILKQINDEQFLNSDITFREIEKVKNVIIKKLLNIYHARIEYPD